MIHIFKSQKELKHHLIDGERYSDNNNNKRNNNEIVQSMMNGL